ncbi:MAG: flagellar hook-associated protein FlgK [Firmicutes bacterium]|nr:flagellar hook-associated protein FlgK [Bacillota bacterium]
MRSTFFGLDIARKALAAQMRALDVTGHNIANQATPGYSRQRAVLTTTNPYTVPGMHSHTGAGQVGTGVQVSTIYRLRDNYIDYQLRSQSQHLGKAAAENQTLDRVEGIFGDLQGSGLKTAIAQFFNAWQDLSRDASNETVRAIVQQRGVAVADMFRHVDSQLQDVVEDINHGISLTITDINSIVDRIASLNAQIQTSELGGKNANDLRDRRDLLIDELSQLINVHVFENNGQLSLVVNGVSIVRHESVTHMKLSDAPDQNGIHQVVWINANGDEGAPVRATSGRLAGLESSRSKTLSYMDRLDQLAREFAEAVNNQHKQGRTLEGEAGSAFFVGLPDPDNPDGIISAGHIYVNDYLLDEEFGKGRIAAAAAIDQDGNTIAGDGSNALAIAQLRNKLLFNDTATLEQFYEGIIGTLGVDAQHALHLLENQTLLVEQLEMRRSSVSGVSLDEEMTNMIQYQHAYNAAARLVTVIDEILDTLINRTGLVR